MHYRTVCYTALQIPLICRLLISEFRVYLQPLDTGYYLLGM